MIALAMTWRFNADDVSRFMRLYPQIQSLYCGISIAASPDGDPTLIDELKQLPAVKLFIGQHSNENRRYQTIRQALEFADATAIHYCDGDHVISRMERYLSSWQASLAAIYGSDCLIIGRSQAVLDSYPRALRETEQIVNLVGSHLLGQMADFGSGTRGFSRRAVEFLVEHAFPETHGVATDLEWPMLLAHAGFHVATSISEWAIYEITTEDQHQRLESVEQWSKRTNLARLIIQAGIDAANRRDLPQHY